MAIEDTDHLLQSGVTALYRELLSTGGIDVDRGGPRASRLERLGMATWSANRLVPAAPLAGLPALFAEEYREIVERQQALHCAVADLDRLRDAARFRGPAVGDQVVRVLTADEARQEARALAGARHELLDVLAAEAWASMLTGGPPRWRVMRHRDALWSGVSGAEIRVVESAPVNLRIADEHAILVVPVAGPGALSIRSTWLATGLRQLFDLAWERAVGLDDDALPPDLTPIRRQVLQLMATGMDDTSIARSTNLGIRTVRAHIAAIMTTLDARTRLAAGVEAARRGWLA